MEYFFRELEEPLIPWDVVTSLFSTISITDTQTKLNQMSQALYKMPLAHRGTLVVLIQHLKKVCEADTKTDINNMAIIFGPNLMWAPEKLQSQNTAVAVQKQQMIVKQLLEHSNYLFSDGSSRVS